MNAHEEASLLTTKMRQLGIEERVTAANVCGTSHIVYVLAGTAKAASISPIVPDLASALAVHRKSVVQMRLRTQPSMALEVNHSAPKPLSWRNCTMGARPGQMTMGRSYDGPTPSDYRTSFARHPHILIVGQTGSGKSNLLVGALMTLAWNSAPEKCRWHMIDLKNEDLQPLAKLPHVASFATGQTAARESVRRFDALLRARTENRPGEHRRDTS
jgi:predicted NACHT family NTPase